MSGLVIQGLTAGYGRRKIIENLDLGPLASGTVTALVGPNAAGKSTLLRAIAGLVPGTGSIRLDGKELLGRDVGALATEIGFMPQTLPQRASLSVFESVLVALKASPMAATSISASEARDRVLAALTRVELEGRASERLDRLSGGQRQLASLAQALVREPTLLLLDEPTSALDLRHQFTVMAIARSLAQEGRIVVVILHDLDLAARWADRLVVLRRGAVHRYDVPEAALTSDVLADTWGVIGHIEPSSAGYARIVVSSLLGEDR